MSGTCSSVMPGVPMYIAATSFFGVTVVSNTRDSGRSGDANRPPCVGACR